MQGRSLRPVLEGRTPDDWPQVAYHRYWMHKDAIHNAFAHYGVRDRRHKLIYWYNEPLDQPGARSGHEPPDWELFDCEADPLERINVFHRSDERRVGKECGSQWRYRWTPYQ